MKTSRYTDEEGTVAPVGPRKPRTDSRDPASRRGRKPQWFVEALDAGKSSEDLAIG